MNKIVFEQVEQVGVYGLGVVGRSVVRFLRRHREQHQYAYKIQVYDDAKALHEPKEDVEVTRAQSRDQLFSACDYVIVSPGIDPVFLGTDRSQYLCELDLFAQCFIGTTVGITGTVGKTSVTGLLSSYLSSINQKSQSAPLFCGGNIGQGMLDAIATQQHYTGAVLELSSYQLEHNHTFAADYAVITNLYPNHLNRHHTLESYAQAKYRLLLNQRPGQRAYIGLSVARDATYQRLRAAIQSRVCLVSSIALTVSELQRLAPYCDELLYLQGHQVLYKRFGEPAHVLFELQRVPAVTFFENWLFVCGVLYHMGRVSLLSMNAALAQSLREHRLEYVTTLRGVTFYNDSKATVMQATDRAIMTLAQNSRPIIVILGGRTKGVDPTDWVDLWLAHPAVKLCFAFGEQWFDVRGVHWYATLEELFKQVMMVVHPGDQVLFSPSGESFDLYENYAARGAVFKGLVEKYAQQKT